MKPMSVNMWFQMLIFESCTFDLSQGHIFADDVKKEQEEKKIEKVEKRVKSKIDVTFPIEKWTFRLAPPPLQLQFWDEGQDKENVTSAPIFKSCTFYLSQGHISADDVKRDKKWNKEKKTKRLSTRA